MCKYLNFWLIIMITLSSSGLSGCTYHQKYPKFTIEIQISDGEKEEFLDTLKNFSSKNGFLVEDFSKRFPSGTETTFFDFKNPEGVLIRVNDLISEKHFVVSIFGDDVDKVSSVVQPLMAILKEKWPYTVTIKKIETLG